jgi:hypothetical protein
MEDYFSQKVLEEISSKTTLLAVGNKNFYFFDLMQER